MQRTGNNIVVEIKDDFGEIRIDGRRLKKMVGGVCKRFDIVGATVSIAVLDDAAMRKISRRYLRKSSSTDVISFDLSDDSEPDKTFELVVNGPRAARQAKLRKHEPESELALYIAHGLLHNLGFDDSSVKNARRMHNTEDEILQQFGYGKVYSS